MTDPEQGKKVFKRTIRNLFVAFLGFSFLFACVTSIHVVVTQMERGGGTHFEKMELLTGATGLMIGLSLAFGISLYFLGVLKEEEKKAARESSSERIRVARHTPNGGNPSL